MNAIAYNSSSSARHYVTQRSQARKASRIRRKFAKQARNIIEFAQLN